MDDLLAVAPPESEKTEPPKPSGQVAVLKLPDGTEVELPIVSGTDDTEQGLDIRGLYAATGMFTFDPAYANTAACHSAITHVDKDGHLYYRGYDLEDLAAHSDLVDVSVLVYTGSLPTKQQRIFHVKELSKHTLVHESLTSFFKGFKTDAHPMAIMVGVVGALSSFFHNDLDINSVRDHALVGYRLVGQMPSIAAIAYRTSRGFPIVFPRNSYSYCENFLHMMFSNPSGQYTVDPAAARALETYMICHLDHGQNPSTAAVRIAGSSQADPYACVASGITSLWGSEAAGSKTLSMLDEIGTVDGIPAALARGKDKSDPFRLIGFGHRIYKAYDPRAKVLKEACRTLFESRGEKNARFELAVALEKAAAADEYYTSRKIYPNVDLYAGILLDAIGIPRNMFVVMFSVARTCGWVAQWKEMMEDPAQKISRPRQRYQGHTVRPYVPLDERKEA